MRSELAEGWSLFLEATPGPAGVPGYYAVLPPGGLLLSVWRSSGQLVHKDAVWLPSRDGWRLLSRGPGGAPLAPSGAVLAASGVAGAMGWRLGLPPAAVRALFLALPRDPGALALALEVMGS